MFATDWGAEPAAKLPMRALRWYRSAAAAGDVYGRIRLLRNEVDEDPKRMDDPVLGGELARALDGADPRLAGFVAFYCMHFGGKHGHDIGEMLWRAAEPRLERMAPEGDPFVLSVLQLPSSNRGQTYPDTELRIAATMMGRAEAGDVPSQYQVAWRIRDGDPAAEAWYRRAANGGHPLAQRALANLLRGCNDPAARAEADRWKAAAEDQSLD
jgi:TPR repeat protein